MLPILTFAEKEIWNKVKNQNDVLIASFQATCYNKRVPLEGVDALE